MKSSNSNRIEYLFRETALKFSGNIAVSFGHEKITYKELDDYSNKLSNYISKNITKKTSYVGICFNRGIDSIISILAVLKAGCGYIPIDPSYPKERINYIIQDGKLDIVLLDKVSDTIIGNSKVKKIILDLDKIILLEDEQKQINISPNTNNAYIIYTSGTTGNPKGVIIPHHNVLSLFNSTHKHFRFSEKDKWTLFHSISFDFSIWEIFGALLYGGELVIVPYKISRIPNLFLKLVKEKKISVLNQTPTAFNEFIQVEKNSLDKIKTLKYIIFGGEKLDLNTLKPWIYRYSLKEVKLINMYGITEATVHVTYKELCENDFVNTDLSSIGVPISDMKVYLFDQNGIEVKNSDIGEMYIAGEGLAKGYFNNEGLTKERFITKTINNTEVKLYKTGDEAYFHNNELYYVGRNDSQIQLNGFRIELDEIETIAKLHNQVSKSVVIPVKISENQLVLVNYILSKIFLNDFDKKMLSDEIAKLLKDRLPSYMLPFNNVVLDNFPVTNNGKLDIKELSKEGVYNRVRKQEGSVSEKIKLIWSKVLGIQEIPLKEDFFDLGGTSLSLIQLIKQTENEFSIVIDTGKFIEELTLEIFISETKKNISKNKIRQKLTRIWCEVLGIKETPFQEDFFDLGGTSLSLIQLIKHVENEFSIAINTSKLIEELTLKTFTLQLEEQINTHTLA